MASKIIKGLTVEIGGDTTKLGKALEDVDKKSRDLSSELGQVNKLLKLDPGNTELLAQKQKILADAVGNTKERLDKLKEAEKQVQKQFERGEVSEAQVRALKREIVATENKLSSYEKEAEGAGKANKKLADSADKAGDSSAGLGSKLASVAKGGLAAVATGVAALVAGLVASAEVSREYRTEMGKLDTAFTTAGHSSEAATQTYKSLQGVLGDSGQAVEAANHLAKLAKNEQDLANWTNIATGVYGTFGASLPIEGLTEAANETAKTGALTGSLADALNWAGVSEEKFQAQLDACSSEQERQTLIMDTLNGLYSDAADKYRETNAEIIRANEANEAWAASTAEVGGAIEPILTDVKLLGASLVSDLLPGVTAAADAFRGILNGEEGSEEELGMAISGIFEQIIAKITEMLPVVAQVAVSLITTLAQNLVSTVATLISTLLPQLLPVVGEAIPQILATLAAQLPTLLQAIILGVSQILVALGEMLPELIPIAIDAVLTLAETLLDNIDQLIDAGIFLIMSLADGLIAALPRLIEKAPVIIDKLISAITRNLPKILKMGVELVIKLAAGLIKAIPQLVSKIPQIITSIVLGLKDGIIGIKEVGTDLIKGLWNGIKDMTSWITGKLKGFGDSVLGGIKSFFGIKSPSRVFRDEVGKMLAVGLAEGIEDNADQPLGAMEDLSNGILGEAGDMNGLTLERRLQHTFSTPETISGAERGMMEKLDRILAAIERGQVLTIDGKTLVGATADRYDTTLGQRHALVARGAL